MRKLILVAAVALVSTAAHAGQSRGLSLASTMAAPSATEQSSSQTQSKTPLVEDKSTSTARPKRKHLSTEARIIQELHRHGIYW